MREKTLILILTFLLIFSLTSNIGMAWWNESWKFRVPIDINSSKSRENVSIAQEINFTQILENNNIPGNFDPNSIRVVENNYSSPYDWNTSKSSGNLTWIANGTVNSTTRRFWIYFDIGVGEKNPGKMMKEKPYWRSNYTDYMNCWSNCTTSTNGEPCSSSCNAIGYEWNRSWAKSMDIFWKWSTESPYDKAYLYLDGSKIAEKSGNNSELLTGLLGNSIVGRFDSDYSTVESTTDEYGTYGCAIDWIKFYPVSNYTDVEINQSLGSLDKQNLKTNLIEPKENSTKYFPNNITLRSNLTDKSGEMVTGGSVNFTLKYNDSISYFCPGREEDTDGYYNCSWNSIGKEIGNYSIIINASKEYYQDNSTVFENRFELDKRQLKIKLIEPEDNSTKYRGNNITFSANLTDQFGFTVPDASLNFTVIYNSTENYTLSGVHRGNGLYNVSWDSTEKELGNYSVLVKASKQYYYPNSTRWTDRFDLETGPPIVSINISSNESEQLSWIQINSTIEDQSETGLKFVRVNITQPNGFKQTENMTNVSGTWIYNYTNTSQRGVYNITVYAKDNREKVGSSEENFTIFIDLNVSLRSLSDIYYRGDRGTVYYLLEDISGSKLSNANITLRIKGPEGKNFWKEEKVTNSNGTFDELSKINLGNDWPFGNYSLLTTTRYFDSITNKSVSEDTEFIFKVMEKPDSLILDLEESKESSNELGILATVTDGLKNIDPDWINVSLYDPADSIVCIEEINGSCQYNVQMDKREGGLYYKKHSPNSSIAGSWRWKVKVSENSQTITKEIFTKLSTGIFDLRNISITDNGISDLGISAVVENKGSGRDVTIEWNLTRTDTGESLDSGMDTFYVGGNSEKTHSISPQTNYLGEVKIKMILFDTASEEAKAGAYEIFTTEEEEEAPPAPAAAAVAKERKDEIEIISYPKEVEIEKGWSGYAILDVNNSGDFTLNNIRPGIEGIDERWYELPEKIEYLNTGETGNFTIKFEVPKTAESGNYHGNFTVISDEDSDKKSFVLRVFKSERELVYYKIQTLKNRLEKLEGMLIEAENENKDVTEAKELLDESRGNIRIAEEYLDSQMYDKVKNKVRITRDLLDKAEIEIKTAKKYFIPLFGPMAIQYQLLIVTGILIFVLVLIIYVVKKVKHISPKRIPSAKELKKMVLPRKNLKKLKDEKERLKKTLKLLKEENKEGIISDETYKELKENNQKKLRGIYKKLREEKGGG